jgi:hypothetical protein
MLVFLTLSLSALRPILIVILFMTAFWTIRSIRAQKRRQALTALAQQMGFTYEGDDWSGEGQAPVTETALFQCGRRQAFHNIMVGAYAGLNAGLFDYQFTTGVGRSSRTYVQTVAAFWKGGLCLPEFAIYPEGIFEKLGNVFSHRDIHFDAHPEFSCRYVLRGPEEEKIRQLFSDGLVTFLESLDPARKWHLEGADTTIVLYRGGKPVKPEQLQAFLEEASSIATSVLSWVNNKQS